MSEYLIKYNLQAEGLVFDSSEIIVVEETTAKKAMEVAKKDIKKVSKKKFSIHITDIRKL